MISMVVEDKSNWFPLALTETYPVTLKIRVISMRTTPPFSPMRFSTFLHIHADDHDDFSLVGQTEFEDVRWMRPSDWIGAWQNNVIKIAPPVVTLLMEVDRYLRLMDQDMERVAIDLETRMPGRRSILFAHGVEVIPVKTATLPPADHTNCYLVGDHEVHRSRPCFPSSRRNGSSRRAVEDTKVNLLPVFYTDTATT